jgi:pre-mRNA 3'-end-processing factor FIP1
MDVDEDDDFYAPEEPSVPVEHKTNAVPSTPVGTGAAKSDSRADDLEEGEEEDEGAEMDEDDDDSVSYLAGNTFARESSTDRPGRTST